MAAMKHIFFAQKESAESPRREGQNSCGTGRRDGQLQAYQRSVHVLTSGVCKGGGSFVREKKGHQQLAASGHSPSSGHAESEGES